MDPYLLSAALAAFVTAAIHTFIGGSEIARPLLESGDVPAVPKYTHYACWHIVTLTLVAIGFAFLWAGYTPGAEELGWFALALTCSFLLWGVSLIIWKKQSFRAMPQWVLFLAIIIPATIGLLR